MRRHRDQEAEAEAAAARRVRDRQAAAQAAEQREAIQTRKKETILVCVCDSDMMFPLFAQRKRNPREQCCTWKTEQWTETKSWRAKVSKEKRKENEGEEVG